MSNCSCSSCGSSKGFTKRSNRPISSADKDLSDFFASTDFNDYIKNFSDKPIESEMRLVTFNNTTMQALWLPCILDNGEKQVLFTFYTLGTNEYLSFVVNSRGSLDDLLNLSGEWNLFWVNKKSAISGSFTKSTFTSLVLGTSEISGKRSILRCMADTVNEMGPASYALCLLAAEECLLGIGIDCAWEHLWAK